MINKVTGADVPVIVREEGMKPEYSGDNSRLLKEIGDFHFTPLEVAIKELYDHYSRNSHMIDRRLLVQDKE